MIDPETLFLRTLADMEERLGMEDPYEILLIADLLRKLFLDDHPLVDRVNSKHRVKLSFEVPAGVGDYPDFLPTPTLWSVQDGLDPEVLPLFIKRESLGRDAFFSIVVARVGGHQFSVREIVLFEANVVGAVHAGAPKKEKEQALYEIDRVLSFGGYASALRQLRSIARVVLRAVEPLRERVQNG